MKLLSRKARVLHNSGVWTLKEAKEYDDYFKDKAKDHGLDPEDIDSAPDEKVSDFFDAVDSGWEAKDKEKDLAEGEECDDEVEEGCDKDHLDEAVRVNTNQYEASSGQKPRGFGSWAFAFDADYPSEVGSNEIFWVKSSKYSDALKKAKAEAKKRGAFSILVMP